MKKKPLNLLMNEMEGVIHLISKIKKSNMKAFNKLCERSLRSIKNGNKIIFFGNGGSASDSQHLAAELVCKYKKISEIYETSNATFSVIGQYMVAISYMFTDSFFT